MSQLSRRITPITLFTLSMNALVGSGWLFAPLYAAKIAGPAAIFSWMIGGLAALLIAFTFAELSTMFPVAGGTAHIPQISHGAFASFILTWIAWISSITMTPIEVQAVLQYASLFFPSLTININGTAILTWWGTLWAAILMISLCVINIVSYRGLVRFNLVIFLFKFSVIVITIFTFLHIKFTPQNFSGMMGSIASIDGWKAIFSAVATGGIVLAFNGFKSGVELAGESKNLKVALPISTAGSVIACLLLYLGLQICFIGALDPKAIASGWSNVNFAGDIGPFVGMAQGLGLFLLVKLLYANSIVSPLGAGLIYVTSNARILYAMSKIGYMPKFLSRLNNQKFPMWAIFANFLVGMLAFFPLPGWQAMVNFLVSAMVISYAAGPIALLSMRLSLPQKERPFKLPAAKFLCLLAFYFCNLFSYWTGWETISKLSIILLIGGGFFLIGYLRGSVKVKSHEIKSGIWILFYLIGLIIISYLGAFGGKNIIPFGWDFLVLGLFSIFCLYLAIKSHAYFSTKENIGAYIETEKVVLEQS